LHDRRHLINLIPKSSNFESILKQTTGCNLFTFNFHLVPKQFYQIPFFIIKIHFVALSEKKVSLMRCDNLGFSTYCIRILWLSQQQRLVNYSQSRHTAYISTRADIGYKIALLNYDLCSLTRSTLLQLIHACMLVTIFKFSLFGLINRRNIQLALIAYMWENIRSAFSFVARQLFCHQFKLKISIRCDARPSDMFIFICAQCLWRVCHLGESACRWDGLT
jgi:hypothetical protein